MNILFVIYPFGAIFNILYTYYTDNTKDNRPYTALTETRTRVSGFKVLSDNHYTIRAIFFTIYYTFLHFIQVIARRGVRTLAADATRS